MMKSFKQFCEDIFIGHKLKLQELRKKVIFSGDYISIVNKELKNNSDIGEFGNFCKGYESYVTMYWKQGGRKLQPSKKECIDTIIKGFGVKSLNDLPDAVKDDLDL